MMNFLRKHQKKLFIAISVMVIASFLFFGTFSTLMTREIPDKKIGKTIDGSTIMERELHAMIQFLSLGSNEVLKNDLISTKIIAMLAEHYFDGIKDDFSERLEKAKKYTPYTHPQVPFLSATQVWNRFIPQLPKHLKQVQQGDLSPKTFGAYSELYLDQAAFPPEYLCRVLSYQQQQYQWIPQDQEVLDPRRHVLFGYRTFDEWFGPRFVEILGKFIFNGAVIAEEKGYRVSLDEARADLLQICLQTLRTHAQKPEITYAEASEFLRSQVQVAGIDETAAAKVWKKVILVHRLFHDIRNSVLVDPLSYNQFTSYTDEAATVEIYQLPNPLKLEDFHALLQLEYYLDATSPKTKTCELPKQFLKIEEIEEKNPELIVSRYELEVAKIAKEDVGDRLTLKETWDFETSDDGWKKIVSEYPILAKTSAETKEDRYRCLDDLDGELRLKVDRLARSILVDNHPEWIEEAISKVKPEKQSVALRSKGGVAPFQEIEDTTVLRAFLENATLGEPTPLFSQDHQNYYKLTVVSKPESKEVMTFEEAQGGEWLSELLDKKLQKAYEEVRKKDPTAYKLPDGSWKPFSEVRDTVGSVVYADHLKRISPETLSLDHYPMKRFVTWMEGAKKGVQEGQTHWLEKSGKPLLDQWVLSKETKEIKRKDRTVFPKNELFTAAEGYWSSISDPSNGDLAFFHLLKKGQSPNGVLEKVVEGQRCIGMDASRLLMHQILDRTDKK